MPQRFTSSSMGSFSFRWKLKPPLASGLPSLGVMKMALPRNQPHPTPQLTVCSEGPASSEDDGPDISLQSLVVCLLQRWFSRDNKSLQRPSRGKTILLALRGHGQKRWTYSAPVLQGVVEPYYMGRESKRERRARILYSTTQSTRPRSLPPSEDPD